jgi:hypothetical protein
MVLGVKKLARLVMLRLFLKWGDKRTQWSNQGVERGTMTSENNDNPHKKTALSKGSRLVSVDLGNIDENTDKHGFLTTKFGSDSGNKKERIDKVGT